jgi:hypothetical protein
MGRLNIIYDNRRPEKYEPLIDGLIEQGITDYKIWDCVMLPSVVDSIAESHKMIIRDAMEQGLDRCLVAEDDLMFSCKGAWDYYLNNMPKEFDLYLGCTYVLPISNNVVCGFHLYCVDKGYFQVLLDVPRSQHIDTYMNELKGDYKFCYPFPALQRSGFSANNRIEVNYNSLLKDEDIYKG